MCVANVLAILLCVFRSLFWILFFVFSVGCCFWCFVNSSNSLFVIIVIVHGLCSCSLFFILVFIICSCSLFMNFYMFLILFFVFDLLNDF